MRAPTLAVVTMLLGALMVSGNACGAETMSIEQVVKTLRSEIVVGMERAEVERRLDGLPVTYVYVSRADLEMTGETRFAGQPLSGRFDVQTRHEAGVVLSKHAAIAIELDEHERVVNVRIRTFGFTLDDGS